LSHLLTIPAAGGSQVETASTYGEACRINGEIGVTDHHCKIHLLSVQLISLRVLLQAVTCSHPTTINSIVN